jgi:hypothetical protein
MLGGVRGAELARLLDRLVIEAHLKLVHRRAAQLGELRGSGMLRVVQREHAQRVALT